MTIERDSIAFRILERLCAMPRPVRGMTGTKLEAEFGSPDTVDELAAAGLVTRRGWHDGPPGAVWIPTPAGEKLYRKLSEQDQRKAGSTPF